MTCKTCAERRAKWKKKLAEKRGKRQGLQAAGITAALAITELGGKVFGLGEEKEDGAGKDIAAQGNGTGDGGRPEPDSPGTGEAG